MENRYLVFGIGNTLRGDDGAGVLACEQWALQANGLPIDFHTCHQLTPELAEMMAGRPGVIFLDASLQVEIGRFRVRAVLPAERFQCWGHRVQAEQLLALTRDCYGMHLSAWSVEFGAGDFEAGAEVQPAVVKAIRTFVRWVRRKSPCVLEPTALLVRHP